MPDPDDFLEKLPPDDPYYELAKRFHHEARADSYGLEAEAVAGRASFSDFVDGCVHLFEQGAQTLVAIRDETAIQARCIKLDDLARQFIRMCTAATAKQAKRLGKAKTRAAIDDLARRVLEISARSKQQIHAEALAEIAGLIPKMPEPSSDPFNGENPRTRPPAVIARSLTPITGFGGIRRRSTRAIKLGIASNQVVDIVVPKMTYEFPAYFPEQARRKVLAARLRAEDTLEEKRDAIRNFEIAEGLLCELILEVFKAFVEEGYKLGMQQLLTAAQLESECVRFLHCYSVQAGLFDDTILPRADTEIPGDLPARIERSEQWRQSRRLLQEVADAQACDEQSDGSGQTSEVKPKVGVDSARAEAIAERAARRQAVVNPILKQKRWKRGRLATEAGVGKNSVYDYLDGTRATITDENRKAIADALGLRSEQLPD